MSAPLPSRFRPKDPEYFRRALDDYESAQAAWRSACTASLHAPPGSWAASVTLESARHELRMAKGRLELEEAWLDMRSGRRGEKSWGSH